MDLFPLAVFEGLLLEWTTLPKSCLTKYKALAALKDTLALLEDAPTELSTIELGSNGALKALIQTAGSTTNFLRRRLLPILASFSEERRAMKLLTSNRVLIAPPYAGGGPRFTDYGTDIR